MGHSTIIATGFLVYFAPIKFFLSHTGDEYGSQRKHRKARCCLLTSIILGVLFMVGLAILDYYTFNIMFSTLNKLCKMQQICTTGDGVLAVAEDPNATCSHIYACAFPVPDWIANN